MFVIGDNLYRHGEAFPYITSRYADGFPSGWTVLSPELMNVRMERGQREYRYGERPLNRADVVHIFRDPGGLRGTPALRAYASKVWGAISTVETSRGMVGEGKIPNAILKSQKRLTQEQAEAIQETWMNARARQPGAPAILPPEIDFQQLAFSPHDLLLLDSQKFDASVICTAYGVPAFMLNLPLEGALIYQNPESLFEDWWRSELRTMAGTIAAALTAQMLPRGSAVTVDATETIEPNVTDQIASWNDMLDRNVVSVNEFRAEVLGLPAMEQGDAIAELTQPPVANASPSDGGRTPGTDLKVVNA
jgi:HK97 family phage portal protein